MLKIKRISEALGKKVYTDEGDYFGEVEESNFVSNKVNSWRIRISPQMVDLFNGARGVIIPHNFVKSVGDVFVINTLAMPTQQDMPELSDNSEQQ